MDEVLCAYRKSPKAEFKKIGHVTDLLSKIINKNGVVGVRNVRNKI